MKNSKNTTKAIFGWSKNIFAEFNWNDFDYIVAGQCEVILKMRNERKKKTKIIISSINCLKRNPQLCYLSGNDSVYSNVLFVTELKAFFSLSLSQFTFSLSLSIALYVFPLSIQLKQVHDIRFKIFWLKTITDVTQFINLKPIHQQVIQLLSLTEFRKQFFVFVCVKFKLCIFRSFHFWAHTHSSGTFFNH